MLSPNSLTATRSETSSWWPRARTAIFVSGGAAECDATGKIAEIGASMSSRLAGAKGSAGHFCVRRPTIWPGSASWSSTSASCPSISRPGRSTKKGVDVRSGNAPSTKRAISFPRRSTSGLTSRASTAEGTLPLTSCRPRRRVPRCGRGDVAQVGVGVRRECERQSRF